MPSLSWDQLQAITAAARKDGFHAPPMRCFVETGTAQGSTIVPIAGHFKEVHTIEIKEEFFEVAKLRSWQAESPIHFHRGATEQVLEDLLPRLPGPSVLFLDAHYTGEGTGRGDLDVPLLQELRLLDSLLPHAALVIIDDLRLFGRGGARDDCDVDWSRISEESIRGCLRPERVACAFPLEVEDRYVIGLQRDTTSSRDGAPLRAQQQQQQQPRHRKMSPERPRPETQMFDFDDLDDLQDVQTAGDSSRRQAELWISTPGSPLDMEALVALAARGEYYADVATAISREYASVNGGPVFTPFATQTMLDF